MGSLQGEVHAATSLEKTKLYLNPKAISITENGIFLQLPNGEQAALSALFSDSQGCFISLDTELATVYPVVRCKNCGIPFHPSIFNKGKCPKCGTQN